MQVTETLSDGLKRAYDVVIPASDLASKLDHELNDMKGKVRINGFRPGKVPLAHLKRVYGRSVMADLVQKQIEEANKQIVDGGNLRLAMQPKIELSKEQSDIEAALEAQRRSRLQGRTGSAAAVRTRRFRRHRAGAPGRRRHRRGGRAARSAHGRLAPHLHRPHRGRGGRAGRQAHRRFPRQDRRRGFRGRQGRGHRGDPRLQQLHPRLRGGLIGVKAGETRTVAARFPDNYANSALAGKDAVFDTTVKTIAKAEALAIDDEFAKSARLRIARGHVQERARAHGGRLRARLARARQAPPARRAGQALHVRRAAAGWSIRNSARSGRRSSASSSRPARASPTRTPPRRRRAPNIWRSPNAACGSGLVLAEVGRAAEVQISDEEMTRALIERARAFPGQEQDVWDYYRNNANAFAELRAPIYEEKAVDHVLASPRSRTARCRPRN